MESDGRRICYLVMLILVIEKLKLILVPLTWYLLFKGNVLQPFAVAVYKSIIYWDDWNNYKIFQADKNKGENIISLTGERRIDELADLKAFGHLSQMGSNACG